MIRPRLFAFPRATSFFQCNRPITALRTVSIQSRIKWPAIARRIKSFSTATPQTEIVPPRSVGYWLLGTASLTFAIVVVGGLTRLTESGITEWKPITGVIPPRTEEAWKEEFQKYKATPEFQILNTRMSLEEFKRIYYMEWHHRILGRIIGVAFILPASYYIVRRKVPKKFAMGLVGIGALIGFQGFLGWWMVQSGLRENELVAQDGVPRVSQYRLAAHLGTAFGVYTLMLLMGLSVLRRHKLGRMDPVVREKLIESLSTPEVKRFRGKVVGLSHIIFLTALSGALVAGLDAGLIYNEFPKMGKGYIPPTKELFNPYYTRTSNPSTLSLIAHNIGENPVLAQLDHRILAITTFTLISLAWLRVLRRPLPSTIKRGMHSVMALACLQVALGIGTLIYMVPTHLAATHQAGSLALLTSVLVLLGRFRIPAAMRLVK